MKVFIGKYVDWFGPYQLAEKLLFWKDKYDDSVYEFGKKLADTWIGGYLEKRYEKKNRKVMIHIDDYDVWGLDTTLAMIIHPALLKLKANKRGAPFVDDEDVPENLRSTSARPKENEHDVDDLHFARYEWIMDELIWAFDQQVNGYPGVVYPCGIVEETTENELLDGTKNTVYCFRQNPEKLRQYEEYHDRKKNAFRLFGKYYNSLWD